MRHYSFSFRFVLSSLMLSAMVTACTLMDNDLRDLPDNPAYREIVHEEGEGYTADYQYQPWTILVDDRYENYIADMDYVNSVLFLYDYIPEDLLPKEGNTVAAKPSEKLEWGLSHKVHKVLRDGSVYAVIMQRAELLDIFKYIEYNQEDSFQISKNNTLAEVDTTQNEYVLTRAGRRATKKIPYDNPNDPYWTEENKDYGTITIDLIKDLMAYVAYKKASGGKGDAGAKLLAHALLVEEHLIDQTVDPELGTIHNIKWSPGSANETAQQTVKKIMEQQLIQQYGGVEAIKAADKNSINDHVVAARVEREKREKIYTGTVKDAFSLEIEGLIQCQISATPTIKTKNYIYQNEKDKGGGKEDIFHEVCCDVNFGFLLGGKITANIDLIAMFFEAKKHTKRPQLAKVIAAPAGLPVWIHLKPNLNWLLSMEGRIGYNGHKYYSIGVGHRKNLKDPKKPDGWYTKAPKTTEFEWNERKKWTAVSGFSSKLSFETQIAFMPQAVLGIGIPGEDFIDAVSKGTSSKYAGFLADDVLKTGVNITVEYDPSIAIDFKAERDESLHGQTRLHFGVPVSWKDLLFVFRPWPGWEIPLNFGDYLCDWLGADGTKEFLSTDWYWYPTMTLGSSCTNPDSRDAPEFHIEFVVDDLGMNYSEKEPSSPVLKIYKAGQEKGDPMYAEFYPSLKDGDTRKHFELDLKNSMLMSGSLKRGETYNARLELHDDDGNLQCYQDNYFTSVTPSAYIMEDKLLAWEGKYAWKTNYGGVYNTEPTINPPTECTFIFNTKVHLENPEKITQLGFYVGRENKRYICEDKVPGKVNEMNAIWEITEKSSYISLPIRPYAAWKDQYKRTIENIWPTSHTVTYDFLNKEQCPRDPNWGGKGKAYKKYPEDIGIVTQPASYYSYGKDTRTKDQMSSVVAKEKNGKARRRTGIYVGEENGVPTYMFTIEPEDLE